MVIREVWMRRRAVHVAILTLVISILLFAFFGRGVDFVEASGSVSWSADGIAHSSTANTGFLPGTQLCSVNTSNDGCVAVTTAGEYVYAWVDDTSGTNAIIVQKLNAAGTPQWASGGIRVYESATESPSSEMSVLPDAVGGAIVVFRAGGGSFDQIRAQRVSPTGNYQWGADGATVVANGAASSYNLTAVGDGANGVIVAFMQGNASVNADVRAQRLNAAGAQQWGANGVAIGAAANEQVFPVIVSDGANGAVIGWEDHRNGDSDTGIYAQRVSGLGVVQWTGNGVAIGAAADNQDRMRSAAGDGAGGAVFVWEDNRTIGGADGTYAQRISPSGSVSWTANGVAVQTVQGFLSTPKVTMSGTNTLIVYAADGGGGDTDVFVQKLNGPGVAQYVGEGLPIASDAVDEYPSGIVLSGDGSGDALVTFVRQTAAFSTSYDVYGQRIDSSGGTQWNPSGILAFDDSTSVFHPLVGPFSTTNASGDLVLSYKNESSGENDLNAQRMRQSDGAVQWTQAGLILPNGADGIANQTGPKIAADGNGNYFTAWNDYRQTDVASSVYIQKVNTSGVAQWTSGGVAVANVGTVANIVSDEGSGVLVSWVDTDLRVLRLDASGSVSGGWSGSGTAVSSGSMPTFYALVSDGTGGAFILSTQDGNVTLNRVTSAGAVPWGAAGIVLNGAQAIPNNQFLVAVPDGSGGVYVAWQDFDAAGGDLSIRLVRVNAAGAVVAGWNSGGTLVSDEDSVQSPTLAMTSDGYVIVAWDEDPTGTNRNILAQKYSVSGAAQWAAGGLAVVSQADTQQTPLAVASDTGAIIAWIDTRNGNDDFFAQRINASGAPQWAADGVVVTDAADQQGNLTVATDNGAGMVLSWLDQRVGGGEFDVYAQRIDSTGAPRWTGNGLAIATRAGFNEREPQIVSNADAGAVIAFSVTSPNPQEARAQFVTDSDGAPLVTVTAPNGGQSLTGDAITNITWTDSGGPIDHYRITLSTDSGATFPTVLTASDAASPYAWTINNITTANARIKIEAQDVNNVTFASDTSDANFSITASGGGGGGGGGGRWWWRKSFAGHYACLAKWRRADRGRFHL